MTTVASATVLPFCFAFDFAFFARDTSQIPPHLFLIEPPPPVDDVVVAGKGKGRAGDVSDSGSDGGDAVVTGNRRRLNTPHSSKIASAVAAAAGADGDESDGGARFGDSDRHW